MATCFVIQPFDRGPFDRRYADVIAPVRKDMERAGFTATAVGVALRGLAKKQLIAIDIETDPDGDAYQLYSLTQSGEDWLVEHQSELTLKRPAPADETPSGPDDIPF